MTTQPFRHLYVHIPFCRHKCGYCDFNAYAGMDRLMGDYVTALNAELTAARQTRPFGTLRTVYLGGGTPSLLPPELITSVLDHIRSTFDVEPDAEVTLEANPGSTDEPRLEAWLRGGVNRLSLGVQGFDGRALAVLERRSDAAQATHAFGLARKAGMRNINIDLIYAVPYQSRESWLETLRRGLDLAPDHVSTWAKPGFESRHNFAYWRCAPVYGAGAGAHSYSTDGSSARRWWNVARPREYMAACPDPIADGEDLDARKTRAEALMLGLRTAEGTAVPGGFDSELGQLVQAGLIERSSGKVTPTRRGMDLHNQIALAVL